LPLIPPAANAIEAFANAIAAFPPLIFSLPHHLGAPANTTAMLIPRGSDGPVGDS